MAEVPELTEGSAVDRCRFGDLGLLNGSWPVIGKLPSWNRDKWPLPLFFRQEPFGGRAFVVQYADDNPNQYIAEAQTDAPPAGAIEDMLAGYGVVEIGLRQIFGLPEPE